MKGRFGEPTILKNKKRPKPTKRERYLKLVSKTGTKWKGTE